MQAGYTGYIHRSEWRWVALVSLTLIGIALAPLLLVALRNDPETNWRFMGLLHHYRINTAYLTRIEQGTTGEWLAHFWYTPDTHQSALVQPLYALLGQVSRFAALTPITTFHIARIFASFFMYLGLYQLAALIWVKVRTRRIFFIMAALGSGFGWLFAAFIARADWPDWTLPYAYPFHSTLVNVHVPLTIGCMAILVGVLVTVFRPGETEHPGVRNHGMIIVLMSIALAFLYPETLLPIGCAAALSILAAWYHARRITEREWRWGLWLLIPALPIASYYLITQRINPVVAAWVGQKAGQPIAPQMLLVGLGLLLLVALPGLLRALRRMEADGDRFMLFWLASMLIGLYLPFPLHQELLVGLMLPIAFFAARSIEETWFQYIPRPRRRWAYIIAIPLLAFSHVYTLVVPIIPALAPQADSTGMMLEPDYVAAFRWLDLVSRSAENVILAAPDDVSAWLPVWVKARVVYGHPAETLHPDQQRDRVIAFYSAASPDDPACRAVLRTNQYQVSYILAGPRERQIGGNACLEQLSFAASFGQVTIYRLP